MRYLVLSSWLSLTLLWLYTAATWRVGEVAAISVVGVGAGGELDVPQLQDARHQLPQRRQLFFPEPDDPHAILQVQSPLLNVEHKHTELTLTVLISNMICMPFCKCSHLHYVEHKPHRANACCTCIQHGNKWLSWLKHTHTTPSHVGCWRWTEFIKTGVKCMKLTKIWKTQRDNTCCTHIEHGKMQLSLFNLFKTHTL